MYLCMYVWSFSRFKLNIRDECRMKTCRNGSEWSRSPLRDQQICTVSSFLAEFANFFLDASSRVGCFQHRGQLPPRNPLSYGRFPLRLKTQSLSSAAPSRGDRRWEFCSLAGSYFVLQRWGFLEDLWKKATSCVNDRQRKANCHLNICRQILSLSECTLGG